MREFEKSVFIEHLTERQQSELFKILKENYLHKKKVLEVIDVHWGKDSIDGNYKYLIKELKLSKI